MTTINSPHTFSPLLAPASHVSGQLPGTSHSPAAGERQNAVPGQANVDALNNPAALKTAFGDSCNWQALAKNLQAITQALSAVFPADDLATGAKAPSLFEAELASRLKTTSVFVCEDSTYYREHHLTAASVVSLEAFIRGAGLNVPKTVAQLIELNDVTARRAQVHPLGNFSGALSWPIPLTKSQQETIISLLRSDSSGLPGLPLTGEKGVLGYLLSGSSVTDADLAAPTVAFEKLLGSAKAQALGQAIQNKLGGIATDISINDYVLAAIQISLDPESVHTPVRNALAGFDLAHPRHWGEPVSFVIDNLGKHLIGIDRAAVKTANLAARSWLASTHPAFLVKGIPPSVTFGSLLWSQLTNAVAKLEADSPGRVLSMSYAEVLASAEGLEASNVSVQLAQRQALTDWGVVNGVLTAGQAEPTEQEMERVRTAYNSQLSALTAARTALQTPVPSRREMALAKLREAFADVSDEVFEARNIQKALLTPGRPGVFPGIHSMLDIAMEGSRLDAGEHWVTKDKRIPVERFCELAGTGTLDVSTAFKTAYDTAIKALEEGQRGLAHYLVCTLPTADRENLEYGKLEFFHTNDYEMKIGLSLSPTLKTRGHTLVVKVTRGTETNIYEIDTRKFTIEKQNFLKSKYTQPYTSQKLDERNANVISKTVLFDPFKGEQPDQSRARPAVTGPLQSIDSGRTDYIAKVFAKSLDLNNDDVLKKASGHTSYDQTRTNNEAIGEFFLSLIPLRSAVVNFMNGNFGAGMFDLGLDVVGLVTLGAGKAALVGKGVVNGLSTASRLSKAARFVGTTLVEAFNPLSGLGDLAVAGAGLVKNGVRKALSKGLEGINTLRGATGSYDVLKAVSKQHGAAATGTFKVGGQSIEGGAVLVEGKWYAFDVEKMRPYGGPLEDFIASTKAVGGTVTQGDLVVGNELINRQMGVYKVAEANINGLSRNSQGVYVAVDGHLSHIRHIDSAGQSAVYEVRQVTRTADGNVQARVYHNNRQTEVLVQHVQGDQWQRLGARGGVSVADDLGPVIGGGGEGVVYASRDGVHAYKAFMGGSKPTTAIPDYVKAEAGWLNKYYGDGFATTIFEEGRVYIKMKKLDGVALDDIPKRSLPRQVRSLLDDALAELEAKGIYHTEPRLRNFLYSARDNKIYPVDIQSPGPDVMAGDTFFREMTINDYNRSKADLYVALSELLV